MSLEQLVEMSYQTFREQAQGARVVLLHPRSRYRSVLVARLVNDPDLDVFYYAMSQSDVSVESFLSGLTHDLAHQYPTFGRHLNQVRRENADVDTLAEMLAKDLAELSNRPHILILDEYDRADTSQELQAFLERLIEKLPGNCQLVINSRELPRMPLISLIAKRQAVVLRDDHLVSSDFYDMAEGGVHHLEVYALGTSTVILDGKVINTWEGHLPKQLFFFALDRPIVTRAEICQAFWSDLDTKQAVNVFHVTKRRLHKALGFDVLVHEGGYYHINTDLSIHYDVMEFVGALVEGRAAEPGSDRAIEAWKRAIDIYRGPFLQGYDLSWIEERRMEFSRGYAEALIELARRREAENKLEHALGLYTRALNEIPDREDLHRHVMRLYSQLGRRSEAVDHYQKLVKALEAQGREPEEETKQLYSQIVG